MIISACVLFSSLFLSRADESRREEGEKPECKKTRLQFQQTPLPAVSKKMCKLCVSTRVINNIPPRPTRNKIDQKQ